MFILHFLNVRNNAIKNTNVKRLNIKCSWKKEFYGTKNHNTLSKKEIQIKFTENSSLICKWQKCVILTTSTAHQHKTQSTTYPTIFWWDQELPVTSRLTKYLMELRKILVRKLLATWISFSDGLVCGETTSTILALICSKWRRKKQSRKRCWHQHRDHRITQ